VKKIITIVLAMAMVALGMAILMIEVMRLAKWVMR